MLLRRRPSRLLHTTPAAFMPTSSTPAFRIAQNLRVVGIEPDSRRNCRCDFRSQTPARPEAAISEESRAFQRSRAARLLGPGSYDPTAAALRSEWVRDQGQRSSFFRSEQPNRPIRTALVDLHGRQLQENSKQVEEADASSVLSFRSVFGTAPGAPGKTFSRAPREIDRPSRTLDRGREQFYDSGDSCGVGTLSRNLSTTSRLYASSFRPGLAARPSLKSSSSTPAMLGPGTYHLSEDAACGGITRARERFRPSAMMAPRVGGKWAHLGLDWW